MNHLINRNFLAEEEKYENYTRHEYMAFFPLLKLAFKKELELSVGRFDDVENLKYLTHGEYEIEQVEKIQTNISYGGAAITIERTIKRVSTGTDEDLDFRHSIHAQLWIDGKVVDEFKQEN